MHSIIGQTFIIGKLEILTMYSVKCAHRNCDRKSHAISGCKHPNNFSKQRNQVVYAASY